MTAMTTDATATAVLPILPDILTYLPLVATSVAIASKTKPSVMKYPMTAS